MSARFSVEFILSAALAVVLYLLDKSERSSGLLNLILLLLLSALLIRLALSVPWLWAPQNFAMRVCRITLVTASIVLAIGLFGIWTWPRQNTSKQPQATATASPSTPTLTSATSSPPRQNKPTHVRLNTSRKKKTDSCNSRSDAFADSM
jgi:hypothetical protein